MAGTPNNPIHGLGNDIYGRIGLDGRMDNTAKLNGVYRARVEFNQDPNEQGRARIRVPELHGLKTNGVKTDSLPWASLMGSSAGYGYGQFMVPEVGEYVMVSFENGDPYKPIIMGSVYGAGSNNPKEYGTDEEDDEKWNSIPKDREVAKENLRIVPSMKTLYKSPTGAIIAVDEKKGAENILIGDGLGQHIKISTNMSTEKRKGPAAERDSEGTGIEIKDFGGQKLTFTATKEACKISMKGTDGYELLIDPKDDGFHIKAKHAEIHIDKEGNMKLKAEKSVDIDAEEPINIKTKEAVNIEASENVTVSASSSLTIEGGDSISETSGGPIDIFGSPVTVGSPVILIDPIFA